MDCSMSPVIYAGENRKVETTKDEFEF